MTAKKIAIAPDDYTSKNMPPRSDAASPRWQEFLEKKGYEVKHVDVYRHDIIKSIEDCHGFMWRWNHSRRMRYVARRLLPVIERELGIAIYPDQNTCWHYDDKVAQAYLLYAADIPTPKTWIFWNRNDALNFVSNASFPLVIKLAGGAGSENVKLVSSCQEAQKLIAILFDRGVWSLDDRELFDKIPNLKKRFREAARLIVKGPRKPAFKIGEEHNARYVLFQEFLTKNEFDTRITVIGNRAFGFRRFNRDGDFRASGSGKVDWNPGEISEDFIRVAFNTSKKLKSQSCAIDLLRRGVEPVVGEVSYTYVSSAVHACPGHWKLTKNSTHEEIEWVAGNMWPEEAQIQDFVHRLT